MGLTPLGVTRELKNEPTTERRNHPKCHVDPQKRGRNTRVDMHLGRFLEGQGVEKGDRPPEQKWRPCGFPRR